MWMQMIIRSGPLRNHKQLLRDGRNDDGPTGLIPTQDSDSHQAVYQLVLVIKPVWPQHYFPLKRYMYFILKNPIPSGKFFPLAGLTCQFQELVSARNVLNMMGVNVMDQTGIVLPESSVRCSTKGAIYGTTWNQFDHHIIFLL